MDTAREAAHAVTEFFQGNPFGTHVGRQIELATDPGLASENWALNIEICDLINSTEEGPRDAVRAIRKRLQMYMGKNNQVVMFTMTVLETCVKNCDRRLHQLVSQKEFVQDLVKLIGPKYDPPQCIQEKVLSVIQSWADAFRGQPDLKGVCEIYDDLKTKGVEFPMTDLDNMAPIFTPKKSVTTEGPPAAPAAPTAVATPKPAPPAAVERQHPPPPPHPHPHQQAMQYAGPINPSPEQLAKLRSELDIVGGNLKVLREMLTELAPGKEDQEDFQLLRDLYTTCRQMQTRVLELVEHVANEEVTSELLLMNDELNNVFAKYDRYMANRNKEQHPSAAGEAGAPLIDFDAGGPGNNLNKKVADMSIDKSRGGGDSTTDEFDMFTKARQSSAEPARQSGSSYHDNTVGLDQSAMGLAAVAQQRGQMYTDGHNSQATIGQPPIKESDYKEMEEWLKQNSTTGNQSGVPSDEFDRFLTRRAEAEPPSAASAQKKTDEERQFSL